MTGGRGVLMGLLQVVVCCVLAGSAGVSGEPQRMAVRPTAVKVIQGQTAILKCVIEHIKGIVQWAKDGVLLGSERDIPGFPRYTLIGSVELGEYNLMISGVRLTDDAEYQCQVTPADGDDALMGSAHLHVLIPPTQPEVQNYPNGSVIKVPHEQKTVNLTCICSNGKPAATITWLRNDELITDDVIQYSSSVLDNKLEDAKSVLTVRPQHEDNGAIYTCRAINDAIRKPLDAVVVLSVMHPPSSPEITGYAANTVKTGDTLKLVCTSKGGNPLAQVYWYKNDAEIDFSYTSGGDKSVNELVFTVQANDNEAVYRCEASNLVTSTPLATEVKLIVKFAPKKVTISGHQHAKAGELIKLKCETAISNPPAVITWFTRGRQLTGATSMQTPSPKGGFVTTSEISVELTDSENNVIYQCHATNDALGQTVVDTVTLEVMYPPEQPTISGYTEGREVAVGHVQTLTCTSVGGNPPAELTWWKGEKLLVGIDRNIGNIVTRQVEFILKPDDNNAEYRCNASNLATIEPLITSVKLQVSFPSKILTITSKPQKPSAGQQLVITCTSSSSNPASVLSWWKDGNEIEGIDGGVIDAKNGGKSTISILQLIPTAEDDGEIYACRATNPLLKTAVSDAVTLDVLYVPVFASDVPTIVNIIESESKHLNFTAQGNPDTVTYTWYCDGQKLTSSTDVKEGEITVPHIDTDGPILNITGIKRADTGTYVCEARNSQGKSDHTFLINVQYAAGIINHTEHVLMDPGSSVTLECTVDANPVIDGMVTWSRDGYDMSRTVTSYAGGLSNLTMYDLVKDDSGVFTCIANNGVGEAAKADSSLVVKFAPEIDRSLAFSKAAAEKGSSAKLICKAEGAPQVTFKWFKNSLDLDVTGKKYSAATKKVDLVHYESAMMVHNITEGDYAKYVCTAENELGTDTTVITLDGTSIPDPPYDMKFVNATHNSITIQWTAGFDGGSSQWFQVRYSETGQEGQKYEDVMPSNSTVYTIKELKLGTEYEMTVRAINKLGESVFQKGTVTAKTSAVAPILDDSSGDDVPLIIILTVCIIGMILLALNILLILFFVRRRKKKLAKEASESCSRANTVEMFSAPTVTEDSKSFASYDRRSMGDYPDDYRNYDEEEEIKRFLPSMYPPEAYPRGPHPGMYPPPRGDLRPPSPHVDHQRSFMVGKGSRDPIYLNDQMASEQGWEPPRGMGPYGPIAMMPRRPPSVELPDDTTDYADQLRKRQMYPGAPPMGESPGSLPPDVRPKGGRLPPPPPQRSSSQKGEPPIPTRNYGPDDIPRYGPAPGSYTPTQNSNGLDHSLPPPPDMMGHLV